MEIWSEFMNRSGEEQDRFLQEVEEGMIKVAKKASLEQDNNGNAFTKLEIPTKGETLWRSRTREVSIQHTLLRTASTGSVLVSKLCSEEDIFLRELLSCMKGS
ncbi:uncharacterized protein LOC757097 [Strongylocentrotus purpuratus]|uniref:Uncharacterized protein n=1 Tax=Strongylocentrotus purpuratus TaxID=7668 RepID=A0A7M7LIN3_STRPU|nr:uncharacterized protein LOC757097 [Strongylocentrotus purpuratus]